VTAAHLQHLAILRYINSLNNNNNNNNSNNNNNNNNNNNTVTNYKIPPHLNCVATIPCGMSVS